MSVKLREKTLKDGRRSLYLDVYHNGRRAYEFLEIYLTKDREKNRESKALADNIRAKRELELKSSDYGLAPQFKKKVDFLAYFKRFYEDKVKNECLRGVGVYKSCEKHLEKFTKGQGVQIGAIDKKWVEDFKSYLVTKMRQNSANNPLTKIKAALSKATKEGFIPRNPAEDVKYFPSPEVEKVFLSNEEVAAIASKPCKNHQVKLAFLFGCYTGIRFSDLKALTWGDIKDGKIHFRQRKTQGFEYLPLNKTALAILEQCRGQENTLPLPTKPVFNLPEKSHLGYSLKPWFQEAGITKKATFHTSRHTFATSLLTGGADLFTVSKLLGHKDISTTAVYAKVIDQKKQSAVDNLQQVAVTA